MSEEKPISATIPEQLDKNIFALGMLNSSATSITIEQALGQEAPRWFKSMGAQVVLGRAVVDIQQHPKKSQEDVIKAIVKTEIKEALIPIQQKIDLIEKRLADIFELIGMEMGEEVTIRDISHDEAKSEIEQLFQSTTISLYFSDIVEQLSIDLELVVDVCNELLEEGRIRYGDEGASPVGD